MNVSSADKGIGEGVRKGSSKTLVITSWAPPKIGGPQSMYNLFSQLPSDSYAVLTSRACVEVPSALKGTRLAGEYIFYDRSDVGDLYLGQVAPTTERARRSPLQRAIDAIKDLPPIYALRLSTVSPSKIVRMTAAAVRAVERLRPTLLLGISDHGPALIATYLTAKITGCPHGYFLFDLYRGNDFSVTDRLLARVLEKRLFQEARFVIVTNEATEDCYRRRYGESIATAVIHNSVFPEDFERVRQPLQAEPPFRIVFTGNIYWAQWQAVVNLLEAMDRLRDLPVRLDLYAPVIEGRVKKAAARRNNVRLCAAPQSEIPAIQARATLLVLALSWNTRSPDTIATATPAKFTDYLASGRPMLVHAPDYAYVSKYARRNNLGIVVDRNDVGILAETIREFLVNPRAADPFVQRALSVFYKNHDARKNVDKLKRLLDVNSD